MVANHNLSRILFYQAHNHIKTRGFSSSIWSKKTDNFTSTYYHRKVGNNFSSFIGFFQMLGGEFFHLLLAVSSC